MVKTTTKTRKQKSKPALTGRLGIKVGADWLDDLRLASEVTGQDQSSLVRISVTEKLIGLSEIYPGLRKLKCLQR